MSMTCVHAGCGKPVHAGGNRFCADHMIEFLLRQVSMAGSDTLGGRRLPLRDWFAGQALFGLVGRIETDGSDFMHSNGFRSAAEFAYSFADAMIAARD